MLNSHAQLSMNKCMAEVSRGVLAADGRASICAVSDKFWNQKFIQMKEKKVHFDKKFTFVYEFCCCYLAVSVSERPT